MLNKLCYGIIFKKAFFVVSERRYRGCRLYVFIGHLKELQMRVNERADNGINH